MRDVLFALLVSIKFRTLNKEVDERCVLKNYLFILTKQNSI